MRFALLSLALLSTVALSACDSGDAVDPPTPADVAGTYDISALRFVPTSSGIAPVSVLDTLVTTESFVRILDGGQAQLEFRREGGTARFVAGEVEVRARQVRLTFDSGNAAVLARLVLPQTLTFDRDGTSLMAATDLTANLESYDASRYGGLTSVPGRLTMGLTLR